MKLKKKKKEWFSSLQRGMIVMIVWYSVIVV